jgi:hypothetical protein
MPYLGGGEHRIQAAIERGDKTIKAVVVRGSTLDELRDHSDFSNLQHGLPLTRHQRREVACRLHMRHPEWSNRELAKRMGTSHPTISAYLKDDSQTTGKNLPPTKSNSVNVSPLAETAPAVQPTPLKETGVAQVGVPAKHRNTPAPSPVDPAPAVVDAEITSFAESAYIQLCELDAKRAGQPIAQITRKKLHGLLDLISEILGTKEVGQ